MSIVFTIIGVGCVTSWLMRAIEWLDKGETKWKR